VTTSKERKHNQPIIYNIKTLKMGAYLDTPIKDKNPEDGKFDFCAYGACSMQGWRCGMEDSHIAREINLPDGEKACLFGVFDGHGGKEVAQYAEKHFTDILLKTSDFKAKKYELALRDAFHTIDNRISKEDYAMDTGTTACVVLVTPNVIICCNAGDSRGVLMKNNNAVELSFDHKP
jgi:serine/threonine protein phosphatase PrpC